MLKMVPNLSESLKRAITIYIWYAVNYIKLGTFLKTVNRHSSILSQLVYRVQCKAFKYGRTNVKNSNNNTRKTEELHKQIIKKLVN